MLDAETSALGTATSALSTATTALGAETSVLAQSSRQYGRRVSSNISDCKIGITLQMCNTVTNHGDMGTFSKLVHRVHKKFDLNCISLKHHGDQSKSEQIQIFTAQ